MCVLLWGRDVRLCDTLDEAVEAAMWAMDSDNDWVDRIEVVGEPGEPSRIIEDPELSNLVWECERRREATMPVPPPHVANVVIDDDQHVLQSFYGDRGMDEAVALVDRLRPRLGDRIRLRRVSGYRYVNSR